MRSWPKQQRRKSPRLRQHRRNLHRLLTPDRKNDDFPSRRFGGYGLEPAWYEELGKHVRSGDNSGKEGLGDNESNRRPERTDSDLPRYRWATGDRRSKNPGTVSNPFDDWRRATGPYPCIARHPPCAGTRVQPLSAAADLSRRIFYVVERFPGQPAADSFTGDRPGRSDDDSNRRIVSLSYRSPVGSWLCLWSIDFAAGRSGGIVDNPKPAGPTKNHRHSGRRESG